MKKYLVTEMNLYEEGLEYFGGLGKYELPPNGAWLTRERVRGDMQGFVGLTEDGIEAFLDGLFGSESE